MIDYTHSILYAAISLLTGGGLVWIFTIKSTKQKARAEAMKEVQDVYQETIQDLRTDKDILKTEKNDLIGEITDWKVKYNSLNQTVLQNTKDIEQLKIKARKEQCVRFYCKERLFA